MRKFVYITALMAFIMYFAPSCSTIPKGVKAVTPFDAGKYMGKWYEIARFDFRFEKNLNNTTAMYSINEDGSIRVENRGYDYVKKEWRSAIGKAKFAQNEDQAMLKVSFFGPFYAGYNVIALDPEYQYALVAGGSTDYLWILSRSTSIPDSVKDDFIKIAENAGFNTGDLIWVAHD